MADDKRADTSFVSDMHDDLPSGGATHTPYVSPEQAESDKKYAASLQEHYISELQYRLKRYLKNPDDEAARVLGVVMKKYREAVEGGHVRPPQFSV